MITVNNDSPFYVKLSFKLIAILLICFIIHFAQSVIVPLAFSTLLAVLLLPMNNYLERKGFPRVLTIAISLVMSLAFLAGIVYFFSKQIANFADDIPSIKQHLVDHFITFQRWINSTFHVSFTEQNEYLNNAAEKLKNNGTGYLSQTFFSVTEAILFFILLPIYSFLLLYYRDLIKRFLFEMFKKENSQKVQEVIRLTKLMIHNYILGLLIEMAIVATLNTIGLLIVGIKFALFFGVLAAVLNIIPYIGMFTATLFTVLVTLTTSNSSGDLVWVVVVMYGIHMIDVNIMMPKIVGSKVRINALMSIIGVVLGGALTGLSGLFLSVPAIAFLKILCDQVDGLKPWGIILGDDLTATLHYRISKKIKFISINRSKKMGKSQISK